MLDRFGKTWLGRAAIALALIAAVSMGWLAEKNMSRPFDLLPAASVDIRIGLDGKEMIIQYGNCKQNKDVGRWFLHAKPVEKSAASQAPFINLDGLAASDRHELLRGDICRVRVQLPQEALQSVSVGQYRFVDGVCCSNLWQLNVDMKSLFDN